MKKYRQGAKHSISTVCTGEIIASVPFQIQDCTLNLFVTRSFQDRVHASIFNIFFPFQCQGDWIFIHIAQDIS